MAKPFMPHSGFGFHWDHIQGIPFFGPLYDNPENSFSFPNRSSPTRTLKRVLEEQMAAPYFPVDMSETKAQRGFYNLEGARVQMHRCNHRSQAAVRSPRCIGFRLETKDGVLVYATDNEPGYLTFDKNVRTLVYDAQYLPEEYEACKRGPGVFVFEAINVVIGKWRRNN